MTKLSPLFSLKKYNLVQMASHFPYKLCRITDSKGDLSKVWYVEYYVFDEIKEKLVRKRVVLAQPTANERYQVGKKIAKDINELLKTGFIVNPKIEKELIPSKALSINSKLLDASEFFLDFQKATLKKKSYSTYLTDIRRLKHHLVNNSLEEIILADFNAIKAISFLDELIIKNKLSNRSRNNVKTTMSILFNFLKKREIILKNPFDGIKNLPQVGKAHTAYYPNQIEAIKNACVQYHEEQLWLFILFIYYCFVRPGFELRLLKVKDIKEKTIFINGENAKNSLPAHINIPTIFEKELQKYNIRSFPPDYFVFGKDGMPSEKSMALNHMYNKYCGVLDKLDFDFTNQDLYSWKHTGVIALWKATQNIELIRQQCRHSDIATTQKYLRDLGLFIDYDQINKFPEI